MSTKLVSHLSRAHELYRQKSGFVVPGVTTVLGVLNKPALVHWAWKLGMEGIDYKKHKDALASVGTLAHEMVLAHFKGETLDTSAWSKCEIDLAENAMLKFYEWIKQHKVEPILVEHKMVSEVFRFGGKMDFYGLIDDKLCVADFKTSKGIYDEQYYQTTAYRQLVMELGHSVERFGIIRLGRDENEGFETRFWDDPQPGWDIFRACLTIYETQKALKG